MTMNYPKITMCWLFKTKIKQKISIFFVSKSYCQCCWHFCGFYSQVCSDLFGNSKADCVTMWFNLKSYQFYLFQKKAVDYLRKIALSESKQAKHLCCAAQYNLGRAYFQGYGVKRQSDAEAEK